MAEEKPVAIVGAGLVGTMQAIFLAKHHKCKVELFEKRKDMRKIKGGKGKSINLALSERGSKALSEIGCKDKVMSTAIEMPARMVHFLDKEPKPKKYGREGQAIYSINRQKLNEDLLTEAEKYEEITLHFEHELTQADFESQTLTFTKEDGSGEAVICKAKFIIGCDGAFSIVRQQMMRRAKNHEYKLEQEIIAHGYKELTIPAKQKEGVDEFAMPKNYLHVWGRETFMMVALPNQDYSFTATLFMPFTKFESIKTREDCIGFFEVHFPDVIELIGKDRLVDDFNTNPTSPLVSVKFSPYNLGKHALLLGDAAHAVVPFFGQGMNAGFEDCLVFHEILSKDNDCNLQAAAQQFSDIRVKDGHAIADLSQEHYKELCSKVNDDSERKTKIEEFFCSFFQERYTPLYTMVSFTRKPYHEVVEQDKMQRKMMEKVMLALQEFDKES